MYDHTDQKTRIRIIHSEKFSNKYEAAKHEKKIKGWDRAKKLALTKGDKVLLKKL